MSTAGKVVLGILGLGALSGAGILIEEQRAKSASSPTPSTGVTTSPGTLALQSASMAAVLSNTAHLTATLTFTAQGGPTAAQSVTVGVAVTQGSTKLSTTATASVPAIASGGTAQVAVVTAGTLAGFASGTAKAVFALASGSTVSFTFQVQATPAVFELVSAQATNSPVPVGQRATATAVVRNTGQTSGTPAVTGVVTLNGTVEGHWEQTNQPIIGPGQTGIVNLQTDGTVSAQFANDTMTGTLAIA